MATTQMWFLHPALVVELLSSFSVSSPLLSVIHFLLEPLVADVNACYGLCAGHCDFQLDYYSTLPSNRTDRIIPCCNLFSRWFLQSFPSVVQSIDLGLCCIIVWLMEIWPSGSVVFDFIDSSMVCSNFRVITLTLVSFFSAPGGGFARPQGRWTLELVFVQLKCRF